MGLRRLAFLLVLFLPLAARAGALDDRLVEAAATGDRLLVESLLEHGADANAGGADGESALYKAARYGWPGIVDVLTAAGADVDRREPKRGNTPLITAALRRGGLAVVRALIDAGAGVNARADDGWSALHAAARVRDPEIVAELLAADADANVATPEGVTPLMIAAEHGFTEGAHILLAYNAEVDARDAGGRSPLAWAAAMGEVAIVAELIKRGADTSAAGRNGRTPLMLAAASDHLQVAVSLVFGGADVNARNPVNGNTALMLAANRGALAVVEALMAAGADVNARADDGWTALEAAEMIGDDDIAAMLRRAGARE